MWPDEVRSGDKCDRVGEEGEDEEVAREVLMEAEAALRGTNAKVTRRFGMIEAALAAQGRSPAEANLEEMEALWQEAKARERAGQAPKG